KAARVSGRDNRTDAGEQLLAVEERVGELGAVEEVVVDLGVGERLVVLIALDEDVGVREEEVGAAVVGMEVRVHDVSDVPECESDLGEARFKQICGRQNRQNDVGGVFAPGVVRVVDVRGVKTGVDKNV